MGLHPGRLISGLISLLANLRAHTWEAYNWRGGGGEGGNVGFYGQVHILIFFAIYFLFTLDVIKSDPIQKSVSPTVNSIFPLPLLYVSLNFSGDNVLRIAIWLFLISRK